MECTDPDARERVVSAVRRSLAGSAGRVLIGYSGGLDSSVLLWAATQVVPLTRLLAVHVNHNAQSASIEWEQYCCETAAAMGVPFTAVSVVLPGVGNFEAAARQARLECFAGLLAAGDVLLLAHHRRDQVETALLRLIQGRGIYGMPDHRRLGAGRILRPLLDVSREDLELCGRAEALRHVEDPSNLTGVLDRSWIRQFLLPQLRSRWSLVERHVVHVAAAAAQIEAAGRWLAGQLPHPLPLVRLPEVGLVRVEAVRWWLESVGLPAVPRSTLEPWLAGLSSGVRGKASTLRLRGGSLFAYRDHLYVQLTPRRLPGELIVRAGESVDLGHGVFSLGAIDSEASDGLADRWYIRFRSGNEVLMLAGRSRRVSTLLQAAVLPWERGRYPLLYCGDELVAIPGVATADAVGNLQVHWEPRVPMIIPDVG